MGVVRMQSIFSSILVKSCCIRRRHARLFFKNMFGFNKTYHVSDKIRTICFQSSDDEEIQEFLDNVDKFEGKIARIHRAVATGSLQDLQQHLDRKKFALAKDKRTGVGILHKAVAYSHQHLVK